MSEAFALKALADTRFDEQIDRAMLEQAGANALFDVFPAARFDHHAFNALQVQKVSEHESRWTRTDNADLRAHFFPLAATVAQPLLAVRFSRLQLIDELLAIAKTAQARVPVLLKAMRSVDTPDTPCPRRGQAE